MSVTAPQGFRAAGVTTGTGEDHARDVAVVVNDGPSRAAGAVFTDHPDPAAPVLWTRQVVSGGRVRAVVLNAGSANAATGPLGFQTAHAEAEHTAELLADSAAEIALCSAGEVGAVPPAATLNSAVADALAQAARGGGLSAADAIRTDDTVAKFAFRRGGGVTVGGMAKGPDASVDSALCVLTTDAALSPEQCQRLVGDAAASALAPLTGTNDTVLLLASGAAPATPDESEIALLLTGVCEELAAQIAADAPAPVTAEPGAPEDRQAHQ
ncbi:bifunctional ornithine acetyltransferase/N-acetylglutamate synthase [Nocardiopsis sp. B62]|uniref:bifunctional ornithine acetyltransferase/N-acetylglutamate synthase n=1 Tax=Nocardiopsis sp. B62 TaxID=2824874 RepID=UPI001B371B85|nr:bifunctional ornithine acetyltransferase/N-acetylglutamate synthase [Nocardiopsis sp. B62]MBQ1084011.1 bifunctional ornithine acetyltransferase/N-acetylglutamate synthase [Nocardiopsis sp. B62]